MERCPKCQGPLQETHTLDSDDKIINIAVDCKRKFHGKKKKGCGYHTNKRIKQ